MKKMKQIVEVIILLVLLVVLAELLNDNLARTSGTDQFLQDSFKVLPLKHSVGPGKESVIDFPTPVFYIKMPAVASPKSPLTLDPEDVAILKTNHVYMPEHNIVWFDEPVTEAFVKTFLPVKIKQMQQVAHYGKVLKELRTCQNTFTHQYANLSSTREEEMLLDNVYQQVVDMIVDGIFPLWLGTPWDFNGTTRVPQHGLIACGYFVATTLRDAGFKVERVKLAQQASMYIMKTVCDSETITVHRSVAKLVETVQKQGRGLYITGLSDHVGYILNRGGGVEFCHSFGRVIWEDTATSPKLNSSRFLSTGKIGRVAIRKWLQKEHFPTVTRVASGR